MNGFRELLAHVADAIADACRRALKHCPLLSVPCNQLSLPVVPLVVKIIDLLPWFGPGVTRDATRLLTAGQW
jgi:hypothetical protein